MLGLEIRRAFGKALMCAIDELKKDRQNLDPKSMVEKAESYVTISKERILREIERSFVIRKDVVDKIKSLSYEDPNVIDLLEEYPITIIDTSTDPDIRAQQSVFALTLRDIFTRAVATKGEEVMCIVVVGYDFKFGLYLEQATKLPEQCLNKELFKKDIVEDLRVIWAERHPARAEMSACALMRMSDKRFE